MQSQRMRMRLVNNLDGRWLHYSLHVYILLYFQVVWLLFILYNFVVYFQYRVDYYFAYIDDPLELYSWFWLQVTTIFEFFYDVYGSFFGSYIVSWCLGIRSMKLIN